MSDIKELGATVKEMLFSQMEKDDSEMLNDEVSPQKYREIMDTAMRRMQRTFQVNKHAVVLENFSVDEIIMLGSTIKQFMDTAVPTYEKGTGPKKIGFTGDMMDVDSDEDEDEDEDGRDIGWKTNTKIGFTKEK